MSTQHDETVADVLPLRPADGAPAGANAGHARAREDKPSTGRVPPWVRLQLLFAGTSLIDAAPPALLVVWARHEQAAKAWGTRWLAWPRYVWGAAHTWLVAPACYFLVWATDSFPKLAGTAAVIVTTLMWFHLI